MSLFKIEKLFYIIILKIKIKWGKKLAAAVALRRQPDQGAKSNMATTKSVTLTVRRLLKQRWIGQRRQVELVHVRIKII